MTDAPVRFQATDEIATSTMARAMFERSVFERAGNGRVCDVSAQWACDVPPADPPQDVAGMSVAYAFDANAGRQQDVYMTGRDAVAYVSHHSNHVFAQVSARSYEEARAIVDDVRAWLVPARLVAPDFSPGDGGRLILWTGQAGTGKTNALRVQRPGRCACQLKFEPFSSAMARAWLEERGGDDRGTGARSSWTLADLYARLAARPEPVASNGRVGFA